MAPPRPPIRLGRAEPWARFLALGIWAFVGISRLLPLPDTAPRWITPWLLYGGALALLGLHRRLPHGVALALLAVQAAAVLPLPALGLGGFEGLLLALVAVQAPMLLSWRLSIGWAVVQGGPLLAIVWSSHSATALAEILGAYSTFTGFALLVYRLLQREAEARQALADAHVGLLATRALVVEGARQGERLRISRELHDSLGHHLTALRIQLEVAKRLAPVGSPGIEPIAQAQGVAREALGEVRRVVAALQGDEAFDLVGSVRALAAAIPSPRIEVQVEGDLEALDRDIGHALFRCAQEAVTNSLKHASGHRIQVKLRRGAEVLSVEVVDDGRPEAWTEGRGLQGIRERAAALGGSAHFGAGPTGFQTRVSIPVSRGTP